ncbi:helix-turn-helix transcriptional regulator [Pseudomonas sp. dw_358]|uniref:AraC family transcriptional regulator n=1 Tax=Pseudomonas sp. dw_358 TaxID=2720083 RepID=UPI001BD38060|nr:helix-turn-helix transcriptional regulator [Pseudomonas sp. dw_358]
MALAAPPDLTHPSAPLAPLSRTYPRGLFVEPHQHDWGQLLYAVSGVMWVQMPDHAVVVPPQRAVWLPPGVPHGIRVVTDLEMRNIYLRPALAQGLYRQAQVIEVNSLLRELIVGLVEQGAHRDGAYYEALAALTLLELERAQPTQATVPMPSASDRRLTRLCQAVLAQPTLDIGFEVHAQEAGASVRTLSRLFAASLGMGFAHWRRQVQLATAVAELIQGIPVQTIAQSLGYSASSFTDMFRREYGCVPSRYVARLADKPKRLAGTVVSAPLD